MSGITDSRIETVTKPLLSDVAPCDKSLSSEFSYNVGRDLLMGWDL